MYDLIYADPPWRFRNWSMKELAERGEKWARRNGRSPYGVMTLDDLKAMPVKDMAAKNSLLAMWTTDPKLPEAFELAAAWGFPEYVTTLFWWFKSNPKGFKVSRSDLVAHLSPMLGVSTKDPWVHLPPEIVAGWHFGLGYHTRANPEPCLLFSPGPSKGLSRADANVARVIVSPLGEHSAKPDVARERIIKLYGEQRRLELFARTQTPGFDVWGNEVPCSPLAAEVLGVPEPPQEVAA